MTAVASKATSAPASEGINREVMTVFAGLMLGSLIASLNMTLVAPALPTIVAELGGLADYSWIPISAMLASTIVTPVAGKLSDIYGRKPLYMVGIVVFASVQVCPASRRTSGSWCSRASCRAPGWASSCRSPRRSSATSSRRESAASTRA
jgi:MFS family permease